MLPLPHKFCASLQAAEQAALREAADTGGILLRIKSLRLEPNVLVVTGVIPHHRPCFRAPLRISRALAAQIDRHHATHTEQPASSGPGDEIGYLVLQTPVAAADQLPESEDGDNSWVALSIRRALHTLQPGSIGAACCARCNRPIPQQRLLAVPNTRVCTNCQQKKEKA